MFITVLGRFIYTVMQENAITEHKKCVKSSQCYGRFIEHCYTRKNMITEHLILHVHCNVMAEHYYTRENMITERRILHIHCNVWAS